MAQVAALKKENKRKRGKYSKRSKKTIDRRIQSRITLASKGFPTLFEYLKLKENEKNAAPTLEINNTVIPLQEESEEGSDEANALAQDICTDKSASSSSDVESKGILPAHKLRLHLRHHAHMESEESTGDDDNGAGNYARISKDKTDNKETHTDNTACKHLDDLHVEVLAPQEIPGSTSGFILQALRDRPKLLEVSVQLTKEAKKADLDVIVQGRIAAMVGLLNIYTDDNLGYSWKKSSEIVAKTQGCGTNHARRIREWVAEFLRWKDLPLHQLDRKRGTVIEDEDVAEEIKERMKEKAEKGYLKAQDLVEIVASPEIQAVFMRKGITKPLISCRTALRWLEKLGWTYGKLKNGMYLDGHERLDVVEYRRAFVER
jgi:hypothetical protein